MTIHIGTEWEPRAQALADELEARGDVRDPVWKAAIAATPRHVLVPQVYEQDAHADWLPMDVTTPPGLDRVYSRTTLVTALADRGTHHEGISSSTKPDLMARMLELLDVHEGQKVLEIGTATGYNAALLAHKVGADRVFSLDLDAELVNSARERLATIGVHPTLASGDGAEGMPEHAPYERIIATCSVPAIPPSWCEQLTEGGLLLADLKLGTGAGNLALLQRTGDRLEGRFTARWAAFMPMRHEHGQPQMRTAPDEAEAYTRTTGVSPSPWENNRVVWFLAHVIGLPQGVRFGMRFDPDTREPTASTLTAPDGSHAMVMLDPTPDGRWSVTESGPTRVWEFVERAHHIWCTAGEPDWPRLGLTAAAEKQWIWIDDRDGDDQWSLTV